jgi:L1 cell adhesion molecule like protein
MDTVISEAKLQKSEIDDIVLIGGSTRIPKIQELVVKYFDGKALNSQINPDEAVAYGAAVHAALEFGKSDEVPGTSPPVVSDVTPLSLGIEVFGYRFNVILPKNTRVPCANTEEYTTVYDGQTAADINIYEGEEFFAVKNNLLGKFRLTGVPSARRGKERMNVTMNIDREGILNVKAVCKSTGGSKDVKIEAYKGRMSAVEIEAAKAGAETFRY